MTKHPLLTGQSFFSGERAARIASTKANYLYAENIFKNASRNIWDDYENTVSKITEEFNEAAASYYSVKPELVDDNALSLLNSGIMILLCAALLRTMPAKWQMIQNLKVLVLLCCLFPPNWHMKKMILSKVGIALWQQQVVTQDTKEPTTGLIMLLV